MPRKRGSRALIFGIWAEKKHPIVYSQQNAFMESGDVLISRAVASQVPSALRGLTSVFGMGTGGSLSLLSPETLFGCSPHPHNCTSNDSQSDRFFFQLISFSLGLALNQALDRLVSSTLTRYRASSYDLSTLSSSRGLTCF